MNRIIAALVLFLSLNAGAQTADTIVSFVNFYPGTDIYELEGHSALRIAMPQGDFAISYGTYDFEQPNFVYRFVKGETDYWVTAVPWQPFVRSYLRSGRRIVEHRIDMDSAQKQKLIDLISQNLLPENRTYRYNYVKDNCATRPLRILELALGDSIVLDRPASDMAGEHSFRTVMKHYHRNYPWYQFGIDLALGSGIDRRIDNREKAFAPVVLDSQLPGATVGGRRLVASSEAINDAAPDSAVAGPTPWYAGPLAISCLLLLVTIAITVRDLRRRKVTRWFDAALFALFGLAGLLISFLVFISVHEATSPNILLLWLNPFCFIPTVFIWINRCKIVVVSYQIVNFVAVIVLTVLWIAGFQAVNSAFIPLLACDAIRAISYIYLTIKQLRCHE